MRYNTSKEDALWLEFAKYSLAGHRMAGVDASCPDVAEWAFADAAAMMKEFFDRTDPPRNKKK